MKVALISCAKTKRAGRHKAKDLYNSILFRFSLGYAERHFDQVFILSARYGLLSPERRIASYDLTLSGQSKAERVRWSRCVASQIERSIPPRSEIHFLCGKQYCQFVIPLLTHYVCVRPLEGLGIGKQLHWYKDRV